VAAAYVLRVALETGFLPGERWALLVAVAMYFAFAFIAFPFGFVAVAIVFILVLRRLIPAKTLA
jgi:hypothetical protein